MPLEAGDGFISGLNSSNPVNASDQVAQGDDHIRLIKAAVKGTFPNLNGPVNPSPADLNVLTGAAVLFDINSPTVDMDGTTWTADYTNIDIDAATLLVLEGGTINVVAPTALTFDVGALGARAYGQFGATTPQSGALLSARDAKNGFEWGHTNTGGYLSTLGHEFGSGHPFIALHAEQGTNSNTFRTRGIPGVVLKGNAAGSLIIARVPTASADNQSLSTSLTIDENGHFNFASGNFTVGGTLTTPNTSASELGFKGVPRVSKTADHTVAAVDAGTELVCSSAADDITVQASGQPPEGSVVFVKNDTGGSIDIIQGSGMTLTLDGTATTGSRTLAAAGRAYIRFEAAGTASVGGLGVA